MTRVWPGLTGKRSRMARALAATHSEESIPEEIDHPMVLGGEGEPRDALQAGGRLVEAPRQRR